MNPLRILVADDHALVRGGICALLEKLPGVEVVGDVDSGREALAAIESLQPDLLLADVAMPGLSGLDTAARVVREFPGVKVIILSMHSNEEYVLRAISAGAVGYLLKDSATIELDLAIKAVARGETYLSPSISRTVLKSYLAHVSGADAQGPDRLTPRQREILTLVAEGRSTKEIAFVLGLSVKTVEAHRVRLMKRLGIHDVPGLVKYAMRAGLIPSAN